MHPWIPSQPALASSHATLCNNIFQELFHEDESHPTESAVAALNDDQPPALLSASRGEDESDALVTPHEVRHDWYATAGEQQRQVRGLYQRRSDQRVSTTDPDAAPMRYGAGSLHLGYQTHYVVDGGKSRLILAVLVTPAEVMENQPMLDLLWHARFRWHVRPRQVTGDTKYGTLENIKAIEQANIRAYIPLFNRENEHGASMARPSLPMMPFTTDISALLAKRSIRFGGSTRQRR